MHKTHFKADDLAKYVWPRKNATLTINNFKKTRDRMKRLCALLRIQFFSQQDDTKSVTIYVPEFSIV